MMFDQSNEIVALDIKNTTATGDAVTAGSFKSKRQARRIGRLKRSRDKNIVLKNNRLLALRSDRPSIGPTTETAAKLTQDPLRRLRKQNILSDQQVWAFRRIRRAVQIITDGAQVRISRINDVVVQTSRGMGRPETDYEVRVKEYYSVWIDRMTGARLQAGPVLDMIIDEMSLSATDRKWGRRKGWAKDHLRASLDLYGAFSSPSNRNG